MVTENKTEVARSRKSTQTARDRMVDLVIKTQNFKTPEIKQRETFRPEAKMSQ